MFRFGIITLQLLIAAHLVASGIFSSNPDKKINEYLMEKLPRNQDVSANLNVASEWLSRLQSEGKADKKLVEGLTAFVAMKGMRADIKCDEKTYEIMDKCGRLVDYKSLESQKADLRRIDLIIRLVGRKIAEFCHDGHKIELREKLRTLDKNLYNQAILLFKMNGSFVKLEQDKICSVKAPNSMGDRYVIKLMERILKLLSRDREIKDPDLKYLRLATDELTGKRVVNEDKIKELTDKYIMKPCQYITSQIGDIARKVRQESIYMRPYSSDWLVKSGSPFADIVPTFCVCRLFLNTGSDSVARKAIKLIPVDAPIR